MIESLILGFSSTMFLWWLKPDIKVLSLNWWKYLLPLIFIIVIARFSGYTEAPKPVDPVETLFDLCGNGARLIKDGVTYVVVCVPVNSGKIGE